MTKYVYASQLYKRMVESGISSNEREAYRTILHRRKSGKLDLPRPDQKQKIVLKEAWVEQILFDLFDPRGKGSWSISDHA